MPQTGDEGEAGKRNFLCIFTFSSLAEVLLAKLRAVLVSVMSKGNKSFNKQA